MSRTPAVGYGAQAAKAPLAFMDFSRRPQGDSDVTIKIAYCGVCHSDIHTVRDEWGGNTKFPSIPGHEIVGHVTSVGSAVTKFKVGDTVGVGCIVDSCKRCRDCDRGLEQYCSGPRTGTYNSLFQDKSEVTQGGYSDHIVVRDAFVLRIPSNLDLAAAAPLLCAGITTFSPLRHWKVGAGSRVGVVGLGGLGHMAVKIAHAMGAHVTVFTTSVSKTEDAKRLGADHVVNSKDAEQLKPLARSLNLIIDTVGVSHDVTPYMQTLDIDGAHVLVGLPEGGNPPVPPTLLIGGRRSLTGSAIGGIKETQEMLDFCGKHNIVSDIETIPISYINEAYERVIKSDVKYRFVIDIATLNKEAEEKKKKA